jgi:thioredoxin 2
MAPIVVPCPDCAALNRLPAERVGDGPVCATCKAPLFAHPVTLDEASFDRVLAKSSLPVVVDFWAGWCGPCKQMEPHFAAAAQQLAGKVVFAKVDTEATPGLATRHDVQSIPMLVRFVGGAEQKRKAGMQPTPAIVSWAMG